MTTNRAASEPLPVHGHPNVRAASLGEALHVLATSHDGLSAAHLVIDEKARVVASLPDTPFAIAELASRGDELLVTGNEPSGAIFLAAVDSAGHEQWRCELPVDAERLMRAPLPLTRGKQTVVVWEELNGDDRVLWTAVVLERRVESPRRTELPGVTHALEFAWPPSGIVRARLAGFPPRLTLTLDDSRHVDVSDVASGPLALAATREGIGLVWADAQRVMEQRFDASLQPVGPTTLLATMSGHIDRIRGYGHEHAAAFVVNVSRGKHGLSKGSADTRAYVLLNGSMLDVPLPAGWIETGDWIGDAFLLIHGDGPMTASSFVSR